MYSVASLGSQGCFSNVSKRLSNGPFHRDHTCLKGDVLSRPSTGLCLLYGLLLQSCYVLS